MPFPGWLMFAGTEVANASRVSAYAKGALPTLDVSNCYDCSLLPLALEDAVYTDPVTDAAPWYDPDYPETADFYGMYPLSFEGFTDSTRAADVGESVGDGGFISRPRRKTREMRVTGLLIGKNRSAADAGMTWLKAIMSGSECGTCDGDDLCFLTGCPDIQSNSTNTTIDDAFNDVVRHMRNVTCTEGPTVLSEVPLKRAGGFALKVEFILTAAVPYIYTEPELVASATGTSLVSHKAGATITPITTIPLVAAPKRPKPILDPDCPAIPTPPKAPAIAGACGTVPSSFFSYAVYIPETSVQSWRDGIIQLTVRTGSKATRYMRVRMLPRPLPGQTPADLEPSSICGEFVVNYIPSGTLVTLDGMTEEVTYKIGAADPTRGDHLVSGVGSEIFVWPLLTCGMGYYMLIDVDTNTLVNVSLSIANRE